MINFNLCGSKDIREDLEKLHKFKNRWFELISGWSEINDDSQDLERSQTIMNAIMVFENLLRGLEHEEKEQAVKASNLKKQHNENICNHRN